MDDDPDLERMLKRRARLQMQLAKLDYQIKQKQGMYSGKEVTVYSKSYQRKMPLIRWWLAECFLCEQPGVATRYPGNPPSVCDKCYEAEKAAVIKEMVRAERERREEAGEAMPPPAQRMDHPTTS